MDWFEIYRTYVVKLDEKRINEYLLDKKFRKKTLNAERNGTLFFVIRSLMSSSNLLDFLEYMNHIQDVNELKSDFGSLRKLTLLKYNGRCCHVCGHSLNNKDKYKIYSTFRWRTKILSCFDCTKDIIKYSENQVIDLGKYELSTLLLLLKQTNIYKVLDIDCFNYIFILTITEIKY